MLELSVKEWLAIVAAIVTVSAYFPYVYEILKRRTTPHAYTWLIWGITVGTAGAAAFYGGAGWGAYPTLIGAVLVFAVFLLSLKYGSRNITLSDRVVLTLALLAILVWWQLESPLLAVLMVTGIDAFGYIPTLRKLWEEPWSESLTAWGLYIAAPVLVILSLEQYNVLTVTYTAMTIIVNTGLVSMSLVRRQSISKPEPVV